ncbi:MAG: hypothetical protein RLZZ182_2426, partial [Pseudomonadota bacterium]
MNHPAPSIPLSMRQRLSQALLAVSTSALATAAWAVNDLP